MNDSLEAVSAALAAEKGRAEGLRTGYHERGRRVTALEQELADVTRKLADARQSLSVMHSRILQAEKYLGDAKAVYR